MDVINVVAFGRLLSLKFSHVIFGRLLFSVLGVNLQPSTHVAIFGCFQTPLPLTFHKK